MSASGYDALTMEWPARGGVVRLDDARARIERDGGALELALDGLELAYAPWEEDGAVIGSTVYLRAGDCVALRVRGLRAPSSRYGPPRTSDLELEMALDPCIDMLAALAAWLMIGSVLRLTVFARRGEIRVLEMLGATTRFIRAPHMLLGFLHTLLGALVAASLLQVVLVAFAPDWSLLLTRVNNGVAFAPRFFRPEELAVGIGVTVLFGLWTMRAAVAHARRP